MDLKPQQYILGVGEESSKSSPPLKVLWGPFEMLQAAGDDNFMIVTGRIRIPLRSWFFYYLVLQLMRMAMWPGREQTSLPTAECSEACFPEGMG